MSEELAICRTCAAETKRVVSAFANRCFIECCGCGKMGPFELTPDAAIAAWNRREKEDE